MEAVAVAATVAVGMVAKEANQVGITKAATAEVAVAAMEAAAEAVTIKVDTVEAVAAATEVGVAMAVAEVAATAVVVSLRRENSRKHGAAVAEATVEVEVAVAATEEAIVVAEDMVEETKTVEVAVEEATPILKEVAAGEIPEVPSILRIIMKATRMEVALAMEEVVETNLTEMPTLMELLESFNSTLAARGRCRSKTSRGLSSSISVSTSRRTRVYFRPKRASQSLLNAGRG
jgi:hypothetical protein